MDHIYDVLIIGAGATGIQAGVELHKKGKNFLILEAQDRFGGRVLTKQHHSSVLRLPVPIELGAEFIHGEAPHTKAVMSSLGCSYYHLTHRLYVYTKGQLIHRPRYWDELGKIFSRIKKKKNDESFANFLARQSDISETKKRRATSFVQGFQAALPEKISTNSIKDLASMFSSRESLELTKPMGGYYDLLGKFASSLNRQLHLNHCVKKIEWCRGQVTVSGMDLGKQAEFKYTARKVLVTVSVGVLKSAPEDRGSIDFQPSPRALDFLHHVEMGHAFRAVIELKPEFFKCFESSIFPFVTAPGLRFHTWWGTHPLHLPYVVAWAGGRSALDLLSLSKLERRKIQIEELAQISGLNTIKVEHMFVDVQEHDWSHDPFFHGAYAYTAINGESLMQKKFQVVQDTLYFAGEAFDPDSPGTVEGALASGLRIAKIM